MFDYPSFVKINISTKFLKIRFSTVSTSKKLPRFHPHPSNFRFIQNPLRSSLIFYRNPVSWNPQIPFTYLIPIFPSSQHKFAIFYSTPHKIMFPLPLPQLDALGLWPPSSFAALGHLPGLCCGYCLTFGPSGRARGWRCRPGIPAEKLILNFKNL